LEVTSETGILGLSAFMALVLNAITMSWRVRKKFYEANLSDYTGMVTAFGIGLIAYLGGALFIHGAYPRYLYILLGVAYSMENVAKDVLQGSRKQVASKG
jgi:hypothetical protein